MSILAAVQANEKKITIDQIRHVLMERLKIAPFLLGGSALDDKNKESENVNEEEIENEESDGE